MQAGASDPIPATAPAPQDLIRELRATVARVLHAEEALAPPCTCLSCLNILKQPVTCYPCGHTLCAACFAKEGGCVECGGVKGQAALPNAPLEVSMLPSLRLAFPVLTTSLPTAWGSTCRRTTAGGGYPPVILPTLPSFPWCTGNLLQV